MTNFIHLFVHNILNSEEPASELLENIKEMFLLYYVDSDVINRSKYVMALCYVTRRKGFLDK